MSEFPPNPRVHDLRKVIFATFRVSAEDAHRLATELLPLRDGPGTTGTGLPLDWVFHVKHELAEKLPWRSDPERVRFQLDRALARPHLPQVVADSLRDGNLVALREAIQRIIRTKRARADEIEMLKDFSTSLQPDLHHASYESWKHQLLKYEALVAVAAVGAGKSQSVITLLNKAMEHYLSELRPGLYWRVPNALFILVAMDAPAAAPSLRSLLGRVSLWSLRVACLHSLPESKQDGTHRLLDGFRSWIEEQDTSKLPANLRSPWSNWKAFMTCLTPDGLGKFCGGEKEWPQAPLAHFSPLIDWAMDHGRSDWRANELQWLLSRASIDLLPLRNHLVQRGVPAAVDLCLEQVRNARFDDYTHYDVVHNALRLHPKPLPKAALEVCLEVIRRPSHPSRYEHRIQALKWLVEAANEGRYARLEVENLVVHVARTDADPDVRVAAIELLARAAPKQMREVLTDALADESEKIRQAALHVLNQMTT